jgi:hypothetical protein
MAAHGQPHRVVLHRILGRCSPETSELASAAPRSRSRSHHGCSRATSPRPAPLNGQGEGMLWRMQRRGGGGWGAMEGRRWVGAVEKIKGGERVTRGPHMLVVGVE